METRNISVSLDQAKSWYKGNDSTLKTLALQAYSTDELNPSIIVEAMQANISRTWLSIPCRNPRFLDTLKNLAQLKDIADYLNKGWKKEQGNTGYFIYADSRPRGGDIQLLHKSGFTVVKHESVMYPLIYFRNAKDAWAVIDFFTKDHLRELTVF